MIAGPYVPDDDGLGDDPAECPGCGATAPSDCSCRAEAIIADREFDAMYPDR